MKTMVLKSNGIDIQMEFDPNTLCWESSGDIPNEKLDSVFLDSEFDEVRQDQINLVELYIRHVNAGIIERHVNDIFAFFQDYRERTLANGNPWNEDLDSIESVEDILPSIEEVSVSSFDGVLKGLSCRILVICSWIDFGGFELVVSGEGDVSVGVQSE